MINNPKLAEDEGDSERAQKLFCFALKQNSDTVGEENQSSQPRERERERGGEEMRTVRGFDYCDGLKSALRKPLHTLPLFIKSEMHLHHIFLHLRLLGRKISRGAGPTDL